MDQASEIYLRVCDTEPCKWELGKSLLLRDKLILLVDNITEYGAVRGLFPELPELEALDCGFYFIRYKNVDKGWDIRRYKHSPKGYVDVSDSEAEYEKILKESEQERKKTEEQRINPEPIYIGIMVILLIIAGFSWYIQRLQKAKDRCYSLVLSYERESFPHIHMTLGTQPVFEEFEATNITEAYEYAKRKFSVLVDSLYSQYNGMVAHDDSLDLLTPMSFRVYGANGIIRDPNDDSYVPLREFNKLIRRESIHGAKWRMSIDSVQHLSFYSGWERLEIDLKVQDSIETVSLLRGRDTLANHLFDEYVFFAGGESNNHLAGTLLITLNDLRRNEDIQQIYSDVKYQLRKRYGAYHEYWDCTVKNVTCDTISCNGYSGVVIKTEFTRGPHKPRFNNLPQAIAEHFY